MGSSLVDGSCGVNANLLYFTKKVLAFESVRPYILLRSGLCGGGSSSRQATLAPAEFNERGNLWIAK
jgi:hypothetical protein